MPIVTLIDSQATDPEIAELLQLARGRVAPPGAALASVKLPAFSRAMAHYPAMLLSHTEEYAFVMAAGRLERRTKEILALAISMTNGCPYCVTSHASLVRRLGYDDAAIVEIAAAVAHTSGINAFVAGSLSDDSEEPLFPLVAETDEPLLAEIAKQLGQLPVWYRVMATDPDYLLIIWNRERVALGEGRIDRTTKLLIAYAVSATNKCRYSVRIFDAFLEAEGCDTSSRMEALRVINTMNRSNKFSVGLQLDAQAY